MSKKPLTLPAGLFIFKDLHCHGFWVSAWSDNNPGAKLEMVTEILDLIRSGDFKDLPYETITWTDNTEVGTLLEAVGKGISGFSNKKGIFVMSDT
ncbi:hypothetical protein ABW19_dt0204043 [Dactylella cylindrospora]|nr:hypothetical protein ABW19_dt0204043 [Dactylella cylindrospora]